MPAGLESAGENSEIVSSNGFLGVVKAGFRNGGAVIVLWRAEEEANMERWLGVGGPGLEGVLCVRKKGFCPKADGALFALPLVLDEPKRLRLVPRLASDISRGYSRCFLQAHKIWNCRIKGGSGTQRRRLFHRLQVISMYLPFVSGFLVD